MVVPEFFAKLRDLHLSNQRHVSVDASLVLNLKIMVENLSAKHVKKVGSHLV